MQNLTNQSFAITFFEREHRKQNLTVSLFKLMKNVLLDPAVPETKINEGQVAMAQLY